MIIFLPQIRYVFNIRRTNNLAKNLSRVLSDEVNYNLDLFKLNLMIIRRLVTALMVDCS